MYVARFYLVIFCGKVGDENCSMVNIIIIGYRILYICMIIDELPVSLIFNPMIDADK